MAEDTRILELMAVPPEDHDLSWLGNSLQTAIELEFATLPPYLCAEWSLKSGSGDPVRQSIHVVLREEMLHFGLMCNMVAAIGSAPKINKAPAVPVYPGPLPGGVHPGLKVPLRALTKEAARLFMEIEYPEHGPVLVAEEFTTIGAFYTAIQEAFERLNPALNEAKQIAGPLALTKLKSLDDVRDAIKLIKRQGEGSKDSPEDTGPGDLAHYYRFKEIADGKKLNGDAVEIGETRSMAEVPSGGYKPEDVSEEVGQKLLDFDRTYTLMLNQLQTAWESGNATSLFTAIGTMNAMQTKGTALMDIPIPGGTENYGPCFRLAP
jgi:hypothetical protein